MRRGYPLWFPPFEVPPKGSPLDDSSPLQVDSSSQNNVEPLLTGYFIVESIFDHKYSQGWRFLTKWLGCPVFQATWEPPKNFKLSKNVWNEIFVAYCFEKGLKIAGLPSEPPLCKRWLIICMVMTLSKARFWDAKTLMPLTY